MSLASDRVQVADSLEAVYDWICENGRGDGLPVMPPTPERVERMIAAGGRPSDEVIGTLGPRNAAATVEKIAINAVMAGCKPEYFPVVLTAVEIMAERSFNLHALNATTHPAALFVIVNGPIRKELEINGSYNCLGPGWRANATIGRAVRLIQLNIAGAIPGDVSKSTQGQPGRYTMCIGEFEERSPWPPLHVERGFAANESTVTVYGVGGTIDVVDAGDPDEKPESIVGMYAMTIRGIGSDRVVLGLRTTFTVLISPTQAEQIAKHGWTKNDIRQFLYDQTKDQALSRWPKEKQAYMLEHGVVKSSDDLLPIIRRQNLIYLVVAGGLGGLHSVVIPGYPSITKAIRRP